MLSVYFLCPNLVRAEDRLWVDAKVNGIAEIVLRFDVTEALNLEDLTFQFDWNGTILEFRPGQSTAFGRTWADLVQDIDAGGSAVEKSISGSYSLNGYVQPSFELPSGTAEVRLAFFGLIDGRSDVKFVVSFAGSATSIDDFIESTGLGEASLTISPIPEPTPTALLLGGLAVLGWMARRRAA